MKLRILYTTATVLLLGLFTARSQYIHYWAPGGINKLWASMMNNIGSGSSRSSYKPPKRDTKKPKLAISTPVANARLTAGEVVVQGTASDNKSVAKVECRVGAGPAVNATVSWNYAYGSSSKSPRTETWSAVLKLSPGVNRITAQAVDSSGNRSAAVSRSVTYVVATPLAVTVVGNGTVSPDLDGRSLEVGKSYTLTAKPAPGHKFAGWTGGITSSQPRLTFTMQPGLVLEARFIPQ
jgi:hypothetical protein